MGSFGENLRREREMRGVTLDEISAATRIGLRFLEAIEAEDFSKLPGGIFNRSFVRAYAKYLGLDEEHVLAEYMLVASPPEDLNLRRLNVAKPAPSPDVSRSSIVTLGVAAALLIGGYALYRYSRRAVETTPPSNPTVSAASSPATAPPAGLSVGSNSSGAAPPGAQSAAGSDAKSRAARGNGPSAIEPTSLATSGATKPAARAEGLVLRLAATERVWVGVEADGKMTLQRVLNPNDIETLKAKNSFDLTIGNAGGIVLTLNGDTLKPLGRSGEVRSVHLTSDDLKNSAP